MIYKPEKVIETQKLEWKTDDLKTSGSSKTPKLKWKNSEDLRFI